MVTLLGIFFFSISIAVAAESSDDALADSPLLTFAMPFHYDVPPYLWREQGDGKVIGSSVDIQELMARKLGYRIDWRFYNLKGDAEQMAVAYRAGEIDVFINFIPRTLRQEPLISTPVRFHDVSIHYVVSANSPNSDLSLSELTLQHGAITEQDVALLRMIKGIQFEKRNLEIVKQQQGSHAAIDKVLNGDADYSIGERYKVLLNAYRGQQMGRLKVVQPPLAYIENFLHFPQGSDFVPFQSTYMTLGKKLFENGQFEHIKQRNMHRYIRQLSSSP